jgi:hypothetical protein
MNQQEEIKEVLKQQIEQQTSRSRNWAVAIIVLLLAAGLLYSIHQFTSLHQQAEESGRKAGDAWEELARETDARNRAEQARLSQVKVQDSLAKAHLQQEAEEYLKKHPEKPRRLQKKELPPQSNPHP